MPGPQAVPVPPKPFYEGMKEAVISTPRLNCYGSRVLTEGINLEQYKKNPILLYMHTRSARLPIGTITNIRIDGDVLYGTPQIDGDTDEEKIIAQKWERGTLRMLSAGLEVIEISEDPALLVPGQTRPTVTKSKLNEVSIVDIGANDDALQCCKIYENGNVLTLAMDEDAALLPLLKKNVGPDGEDGGDNNTQTLTQFSMNRILMTLGLAEASTEEQAVIAIQQLQQENDTLRLARITDAVQVAINEHRIPADKKDYFVNLGKKVGLDDLREIMNLYNPVKKPTEVINPNGGSAPLNLKWEEHTAEQLAEMRENDREKYCKLYKEHYGVNPTF